MKATLKVKNCKWRRKSPAFKNKKGSLDDAMFLGVMTVVLAIMAWPLINTILNINTEIQTISELNETSKSVSNKLTRLPNVFEGIFLMLVLIGYVAAFLLAFYIDSQPGLFIIAAIFFTSTIVMIPMLANVWQDVSGQFPGVSMPITSYIFEHYLRITIIGWLMIGFAVYAKKVIF